MKKKVLITGANGFIGNSLIEHFHKNEYTVFALDYHKELLTETECVFKYYSIDISKPFVLEETFHRVIHLAALNQTNINSDFPYETFEAINVHGTKHVAESCEYDKFILFSTANVYAKEGLCIDENSKLQPTSFYEKSKYLAELISKKSMPPEKLIILRPVNVTGVNQKNKAIIPYFFDKAMKQEAIDVFVPKNKKIQLLSIKDIIRAVESLINDDTISGVFNLSNSESIEITALAERIIALCHSSSEVICTNNRLESYSEIKSNKAKERFNWEAIESIDKILNDYQKRKVKEC